MKNLAIYFVLFFSIIIYACKENISCPAFSTNDLEYIPYVAGDTLTFINNHNDSYLIFIRSVELSEAYSTECSKLRMACPCINYAEILADNSNDSESYVYLRLEQSNITSMQYYMYKLEGFYFEFDFRNELPYINDFNNLEFVGDTNLGGVNYSEVIKVKNLYQTQSNIESIWFNKTNGILKFDTKDPINEWIIDTIK